MIPFLVFIAAASIIALLILWCYITKQELRHKIDMVKSAESQLKAYEETLLLMDPAGQNQQAQAVAERCQDIYRQAVALYNETLNRFIYRIPAAILQYRPIKLN